MGINSNGNYRETPQHRVSLFKPLPFGASCSCCCTEGPLSEKPVEGKTYANRNNQAHNHVVAVAPLLNGADDPANGRKLSLEGPQRAARRFEKFPLAVQSPAHFAGLVNHAVRCFEAAVERVLLPVQSPLAAVCLLLARRRTAEQLHLLALLLDGPCRL